MINSLIGDHMEKNNRISVNNVTIIQKSLFSDDMIEFMVSDFPGICYNNCEFMKTVYKKVVEYDIIVWCSDINSAFSTEFEKYEMMKVFNMLNEDTAKYKREHEFAICLTKCDMCIGSKNNDKKTSWIEYFASFWNGNEYSYHQQKCAMKDIESLQQIDAVNIENYHRIVNTYKNTDIHVMCYNSYGKIYYDENVSVQLKDSISNDKNEKTNFNTCFNLKWYECSKLERLKRTYLAHFGFNYVSYLKKLDKDWNAVKNHVDAIYNIMMQNDVNVMKYIVLAFVCNSNKLKEYLSKYCYYYDDSDIGDNYERYTLNTLALLYHYDFHNDKMKDKLHNLCADYWIVKLYPKPINHLEVCKYWLLFSHSMLYYTKYYECFDVVANSDAITIIKNDNSNHILDISYKNCPYGYGADFDRRPKIEDTCVPLFVWYDYRVSEGNDCMYDETFIEECAKIYDNMHTRRIMLKNGTRHNVYKHVIDMKVLIVRAFVKNKEQRNLKVSIFQVCKNYPLKNADGSYSYMYHHVNDFIDLYHMDPSYGGCYNDCEDHDIHSFFGNK